MADVLNLYFEDTLKEVLVLIELGRKQDLNKAKESIKDLLLKLENCGDIVIKER